MWRVLEDAAVLLSNSVHTHMLPETGLRYLWPASLSKEPIVRTGTAELSQICSKDFLTSVFPSGSISDGVSGFLAPAILQAHKLLAGEMDGYRQREFMLHFTLPRVASVNTPAVGRAFRAHDVDEGYHTTEELKRRVESLVLDIEILQPQLRRSGSEVSLNRITLPHQNKTSSLATHFNNAAE